MTFDTFVLELRSIVSLTLSASLAPNCRVRDDLNLDSLHVLEILSHFAGSRSDVLDTTSFPEDLTLYQLYTMIAGLPSDDPSRGQVSSDLVGRFVRLSPVRISDAPSLYSLSMRDDVLGAWRYRGNPPTEESFTKGLMQDSFVQFVVRARRDNAVVGWVCGYDYRKTCLSLSIVSPREVGRMIGIEGIVVLVRYAFRTWDVDHVLLEMWDTNLDRFQSIEGMLGPPTLTLRSHGFFQGEFHDFLTFVVHRDDVPRLAELFCLPHV